MKWYKAYILESGRIENDYIKTDGTREQADLIFSEFYGKKLILVMETDQPEWAKESKLPF